MKRLILILGMSSIILSSLSMYAIARDGADPIDVSGGTSATVVDDQVQTSPGGSSVTVPTGEYVYGYETPGIQTAGGGYSINVDGTVSTYNAIGINAQGSGNTITNNSMKTVYTSYQGDAIVSGDSATVINNGMVESASNGIVVGQSSTVDNHGVIYAVESGIIAGDQSTVTNHEGATIYSDEFEGFGDARCGIQVGDNGTVENYGEIYSGYSSGISAGDGNTIINHGSADPQSLITSEGPPEVINEGIIVGYEAGILLQYEPNPEGDILDILYENVDPALQGNTVRNDGLINLFYDGPSRAMFGIFGLGNNNLTNNNLTFGAVTGLGGLQGNTITNNGVAMGFLSGILARNNNTVINSGSAIGYEDSGILAGVGNTITNTSSGYIGMLDPALFPDGEKPWVAYYGITAFDDNDIINNGVIAGQDTGIYLVPEPLLSWWGGGDLPEYLTDYTIQGNRITNNADGIIDGGYGIEMYGPGSIINAGAIRGYYGTAIWLDDSDQSITLQSGAVVDGDIQDDCYFFECGDYDELTLEGSGSFSDSIYGIEYIQKTGAGTWILEGLEGEGSYVDGAMDIDIKAGALQIDGEVYYTGDFNIYQDATLAGSGDLYHDEPFPTTVHNDGTIAPGPVECSGAECIGELEIDDSFENYRWVTKDDRSAGNLAIDLYDDLNDKIYIGYEAAFGWKDADSDPGTITVTPRGVLTDSPFYFLYSWDGIYINGGPGADVDEFEPEVLAAMLVEDSALYDFTLRADDYEMWLEVEPLTVTEAGGSAANEIAYDYLVEQGEDDALDALAGMNLGNLTRALASLSPEQYPNLLDISMGGFGIYRNAVTGRLGNLHLAHAPQQTQKYATSTVYAEGPSQARIPAFENQKLGWSSWGRILGMTGEQDNDKGVQGYEFDTYGASFGFDNKVNDSCAIGLGFGLANSDVSFNGGQDTDMDSYNVSLYGTHSNERYYIDAALLFAANDYDSTRHSLGFEARSSTDGKEWGLYLGGGYKLTDTETMYFMPTASIEFSQVDIDGFTESGTGPLYDISGYDTDSTVTTLGFRWGGKMTTGTTRFEPELRLAWAHEFGDTDRQVNARFVGTTSTFAIEGIEPNENSILLGLGANFFVKDNMTLYADYDGEFRDGFDGHALSAGFRYNF